MRSDNKYTRAPGSNGSKKILSWKSKTALVVGVGLPSAIVAMPGGAAAAEPNSAEAAEPSLQDEVVSGVVERWVSEDGDTTETISLMGEFGRVTRASKSGEDSYLKFGVDGSFEGRVESGGLVGETSIDPVGRIGTRLDGPVPGTGYRVNADQSFEPEGIDGRNEYTVQGSYHFSNEVDFIDVSTESRGDTATLEMKSSFDDVPPLGLAANQDRLRIESGLLNDFPSKHVDVIVSEDDHHMQAVVYGKGSGSSGYVVDFESDDRSNGYPDRFIRELGTLGTTVMFDDLHLVGGKRTWAEGQIAERNVALLRGPDSGRAAVSFKLGNAHISVEAEAGEVLSAGLSMTAPHRGEVSSSVKVDRSSGEKLTSVATGDGYGIFTGPALSPGTIELGMTTPWEQPRDPLVLQNASKGVVEIVPGMSGDKEPVILMKRSGGWKVID